MDIVIKNLPPQREAIDIETLIHAVTGFTACCVHFFQPDHPDHGSCIVRIDGEREQSYQVADRLNGHFWDSHELAAYVPLFGQRDNPSPSTL